MMTESQDVAVDLSGHVGEEKAQSEARPPATSEISLEEDTGDESVEELDLTKQEKPSVPMWSFEYYQGFFDVDTDQVLRRLISSFIPRHNFVRLVRPNPDLYGPFWICITLALSFIITGNLAGYMKATGHDYQWTYNFRHLTFAATAIYSYVWLLPAILWMWLWWRGMKVYSLLEITCVYGYSLTIFLPCSILWTVPMKPLLWTVFMVGMVLSGSVLFRTFWPMLKKHDKKLAVVTICIILACHAALSVGFVLYFYSSGTSHIKHIPPTALSPSKGKTSLPVISSALPLTTLSKSRLSKKKMNSTSAKKSKLKTVILLSTTNPPGERSKGPASTS